MAAVVFAKTLDNFQNLVQLISKTQSIIQRLIAFEDSVLRRVFAPDRDQIIGE
jgi:hypothetical protein